MKIPKSKKKNIIKDNVENSEDQSKNWFIRKYNYGIKIVMSLLTQGISPEKIALAFAIGLVAGTFPILGTHTFIGIFFAFILGLNQVAVYLGVWVSLPLYFLLLLPSLRTGELLLKAQTMNIDSFLGSLKRMTHSVTDFFDVWREYGQSILHILIGWIPYAIIVGVVVYFFTLYFAKMIVRKKKIR